jgi:hypothetical protein
MNKKFIFLILVFLIIAVVSYFIYKSQELKRAYNTNVQRQLQGTEEVQKNILTEDDIKDLPTPVQKYLRYANVIGKEKVRNFTVVFEGEFKTDPKKPWAKMDAMQFTDLNNTTRLYYMDMKMFGLPVVGLHRFMDAKATMIAKVAGLFTVVDGKGQEMNEGETVTVFNDMCILAPASLIDKRIQWETIDSSTVKATFTNNGIKIHAILYFNDKGELINFVSENRYFSPTGKTYEKYKWSTPIKDYKDYEGIRISSRGEAVWSLPQGEYSYGKINVKEIKYNVNNQK